MPLSYEQVKTAVDNTKAPNFVPPVDAFDLGKYAFRYGLMIRDWWAKQVANGWEFEAIMKFFRGSNSKIRECVKCGWLYDDEYPHTCR